MAERLVRLAGELEQGEGQLRFRPDTVSDAVRTMTRYLVPPDYYAVFEVVEEGDEGAMPAEHRERDWDALAPSTRDRYLRSSRLDRVSREFYGGRGKRADRIRRWYEHGGDLRAARGHQDPESFGKFRSEIKAEEIRGRRTGRLELWVSGGSRRKRGRR